MKLITTADVDVTYLNCAVFGDSGCGKTHSLKTLPDSTFVLTGERSALPLKSRGFSGVRFRDWETLKETIYAFMAPEKIHEELLPDQQEADALRKAVDASTWLALDSLSEASYYCKKHIVTKERRALVSERTGGKRNTPEKSYEDLMTQEDWGLYGAKMLGLMKTLSDLPINKVCTCRAGWKKDRNGFDVFRTFGLNGQVALEAPSYFDLVVCMESVELEDGKEKRVWRTFNDGKIIAKDSSGKLEPFEDTDWQAVAKKMLS